MAKDDKAAKTPPQVFKGSTPTEVTEPIGSQQPRHIVRPSIPESSLRNVEARVEEVDVSALPNPDEVLASLRPDQD